MTAIFYDKDKTSTKTIHVGATSYPDYTTTPHDEDRIYITNRNRELGCLSVRKRTIKIQLVGIYIYTRLLIIITKDSKLINSKKDFSRNYLLEKNTYSNILLHQYIC